MECKEKIYNFKYYIALNPFVIFQQNIHIDADLDNTLLPFHSNSYYHL